MVTVALSLSTAARPTFFPLRRNASIQTLATRASQVLHGRHVPAPHRPADASLLDLLGITVGQEPDHPVHLLDGLVGVALVLRRDLRHLSGGEQFTLVV